MRGAFVRVVVSAGISGTVVLMLAVSAAFAKGPPDKVVVTGPGLVGGLEITDSMTLRALAIGDLEDGFHDPIPAPPSVGASYELTRYFRDQTHGDLNSKLLQAFDHLHYYGSPSGGRGYLLYEGIIGGSSASDGKWFRISPAGEQAMQRVLAQYGIHPPSPEKPGSRPSLALGSVLGAGSWLVPAGAVLIFGGGSALLLGKRRRFTRPFQPTGRQDSRQASPRG